MKRKPRLKTDPIRGEIDLALYPDAYISARNWCSFVYDLEAVAARIGKLAVADATRATGLLETFVACCTEKAIEVHDSGIFGAFVEDLVCQWIRLRQKSDADPGETAARLAGWIDNDSACLFYEIENVAVKALNKAGLAAFEQAISARLLATRGSAWQARKTWNGILRTIYLAQRNAAAYESLANESGFTPADCLALARLFTGRGPERSLEWVERGIELDKQARSGSSVEYELVRLRRALLMKCGRKDDARDSAWAEYCKDPGKIALAELMQFVPRAQRAAWRKMALDAACSADLRTQMELFLAKKETERLARLVLDATDKELESTPHHTTEPAAKRLEKLHPGLAARLWLAQGMGIVNAAKSKLYPSAIASFERAHGLYVRAGLAAEWQRTASQVRAAHRRKFGFMRDFERIGADVKANGGEAIRL